MKLVNPALFALLAVPLPALVARTILRRRGVPAMRLAAQAGQFALVLPLFFGGWWASSLPAEEVLTSLTILFGTTLTGLALFLAVLYESDVQQRRTTWSRRKFVVHGILDFSMQFLPLGWLVALGVLWFVLDPTPQAGWSSMVLLAALALLLAFTSYPFLLSLALRARPMAASPLLTELIRLSEQAGVRPVELYVFPGSDGRIITGWATGLFWGARRVLLSNYVVDRFSLEEVCAVFAHELGHLRLHHLWVNLAMALVGLATFTGSGLLVFLALRIPTPSPVVIGLIGGLLTVLETIPAAAVSRRHELAADRFAATLTGKPEALISALHKLELPLAPRGDQNHTSFLDLWRTHPPLHHRTRVLRGS